MKKDTASTKILQPTSTPRWRKIPPRVYHLSDSIPRWREVPPRVYDLSDSVRHNASHN